MMKNRHYNIRIPQKVRSRSGESIAETLIALLISCLALLMLASMITSSARLVTKSRNLMETYYSNNNVLENHEGTGAGSLTVTIKPKNDNQSSSQLQKSFTAKYYKNDTVSSKPVISYEIVSTP